MSSFENSMTRLVVDIRPRSNSNSSNCCCSAGSAAERSAGFTDDGSRMARSSISSMFAPCIEAAAEAGAGVAGTGEEKVASSFGLENGADSVGMAQDFSKDFFLGV